MKHEFLLHKKIKYLITDYNLFRYLNKYNLLYTSYSNQFIVFSNNELELYRLLQIHSPLYCINKRGISISLIKNVLTKIIKYNFFNNIEIGEQEDIRSMNKILHIDVTNNCNLRCRHCFLSAGIIDRQEVNINLLKNFLTKYFELYECDEIVISGGEPLKYEYIYDLLNFLKGKNVTLFTNGTNITPKNIDRLIEIVRTFQISFEGVTLDSFESIRGKNTYSRVMNAIDLLKKYNVKIVLAFSILPQTVSDIYNNLISFIKSLNYKNLEIRLNDDIEIKGNAKNIDFSDYDLLETDTKIGNLKKMLVKSGFLDDDEIKSVRYRNCGIGSSIVVGFNNRIYPCHEYLEYFKNLSDDPFDIVNDFDLLNNITSIDNSRKCLKCDLKYHCSGGCKVKSYSLNGTYFSDCDKDKVKINMIRRFLKNGDFYEQ